MDYQDSGHESKSKPDTGFSTWADAMSRLRRLPSGLRESPQTLAQMLENLASYCNDKVWTQEELSEIKALAKTRSVELRELAD
jgi:hypothetical protein